MPTKKNRPENDRPENDEIQLLENLFEYIVPKYREAHDIMVSMLDFSDKPIRIADIGCGFGELSRRLLQIHTSAQVFGLDRNPAILQRARQKLAEFAERFLPLERDLNNVSWSEDLQPLDAIVSSFTLDYLPLDRHKQLLSEAFSLLNPQGRWLSCEFFRASDPRVNRVFHDLEIQFIQKALADELVTKQQIEQLTQSSILRQDHHVCTVDTKVNWLRSAGFDQIEVPWRFLNLAVISAVR